MADTTFVNGTTLTDEDWFNDINDFYYTLFAGATTASGARTALGLGTLATKSSILPADLDTNSAPWIFRKDHNAGTYAQIQNTNTGASAVAGVTMLTGTANSQKTIYVADVSGVPIAVETHGAGITYVYVDGPNRYWRSVAGVNKMSVANGMQVYGTAGAAPTSGDRGVGTVNVADSFYTNGSLVEHGVCQFRLTLENLVPVSTTDQTAKTLVYMTPFMGNKIALYYNSKWSVYSSAQVQVAVPSTTNTPFDVFAYWTGSAVALETVNWTNDTTRATAIDVGTGDNVLCKGGDLTRRYIGTCRTTGVSGQTEDSDANRFVWNYYNRVMRRNRTSFSADRSTTSATYVEINSEIQSKFVVGVNEECAVLTYFGTIYNSGANRNTTAFGIDSTASSTAPVMNYTGGEYFGHGLCHSQTFAAGYHYVTMLGKVTAGTGTWIGTTLDNGRGYLIVDMMR